MRLEHPDRMGPPWTGVEVGTVHAWSWRSRQRLSAVVSVKAPAHLMDQLRHVSPSLIVAPDLDHPGDPLGAWKPYRIEGVAAVDLVAASAQPKPPTRWHAGNLVWSDRPLSAQAPGLMLPERLAIGVAGANRTQELSLPDRPAPPLGRLTHPDRPRTPADSGGPQP